MIWQPIETAPKDGTEVLTYRKTRLCSVAAWDKKFEWIVTDGMMILDVTHWMPLPPPPVEDRK